MKSTRHIKSGVTVKNHLSDTAELEGLLFHSRRKMNPSIYLLEDAIEGYRVIYGTFDFEDAMHGEVLLDPEGRVANTWKIFSGRGRADVNIFPQGLGIASDGSIVNAYVSGCSPTNYDYCNRGSPR